MSFPNAHSQMIYNEAGEVIGWDNPSYDPPEYDDGFGPEPYEEGFYHDKPEEHTPECTDETCETYLDHYNARISGALAESWYYDNIEDLNGEAVMASGSYAPPPWRPFNPMEITYAAFAEVTSGMKPYKRYTAEEHIAYHAVPDNSAAAYMNDMDTFQVHVLRECFV